MAVNRDKPDLWKRDIAASVDKFNRWFVRFAPKAFRSTRERTAKQVERALHTTDNLTNLSVKVIKQHPEILATLRMSTCPPLAVDRLIGLAGVPASLVRRMERENKLPTRMDRIRLDTELRKIGKIILRMADPDIFVWLAHKANPGDKEIYRASTIVADRLCGSIANPIIRNAQEQRQLAAIASWLRKRGYRQMRAIPKERFGTMCPGTFAFRMNVPVQLKGKANQVNIPIDAVVMPNSASKGELPALVEAKSAGDFTNVNKRRKEEAMKMSQLKNTYGKSIRFNLFLCGYFDSGVFGLRSGRRNRLGVGTSNRRLAGFWLVAWEKCENRPILKSGAWCCRMNSTPARSKRNGTVWANLRHRHHSRATC